MYKFTVKEIFDLSSIPAKVLFGEASYCRYQGVLYCDNVKITIDHYVFNEIDEKKASFFLAMLNFPWRREFDFYSFLFAKVKY